MSSDFSVKALVAVLCELEKDGVDVEAFAQRVKTGIMGEEAYAPSGVAKKLQVADVIDQALEYAEKYTNKA
ncbi:hypothetical protein OAP63_06320 [Vibrio sp.]|uniref:Uncharacterized protein n=1 Tax=Vibrio viridaestus TaxID=2487322 RepID=A0A3N9TJK4_9VIBR|nr:hypothetical protein [Vibrio viridaestus]MDC0610332.1 hypothetical protein [Vibrio sp.]RQW64341.1 hypothetical protein EES38_07115 [Vibrio viridaestus]